jgi:CpeT protein
MRNIAIVIAALLASFYSAVAYSAASGPDNIDLQEVSTWIEGSYSSEKQATDDSTYSNERLEIRRIWLNRTDGTWFVMERFRQSQQDSPLTQHVYHISSVEDNITEIQVFQWKKPQDAVGLWKQTERAQEFSPSDLRLLRGCEMYFQRNATSFFGGTHGTACAGGVAGASYKTVSMSIAAPSMAIWERGFASDNKQVFGSVKGPYYFLKQKP